MNHVEVTLYFNELQLRAVEHELSSDGLTLEDKLKEHFAFLYDQLVPPEKQLGIEAEIEQIEAAENAEREARRKFGVFHVHENGSDRYFTSELFDSLLSTAYRYRLYDRGELSSNPKMFAEAFGEVAHISAHSMKNSATECPTTTASKSPRISIWMQAQPVPAKAATMRGGRIRSRICRPLRTVPTVAPTAAHTTEKKNSKKPSQARRSSHPKKPRMKHPTRMRTKPR